MKHDGCIEPEVRGTGVPRYAKARASAAVCVAAIVVLGACVSRPAVGGWGDAGLAAEQRIVIEQQQQRLDDMGAAIESIHDGLGRAIDAVTASLDGNGDLKSKFAEVDYFVRAVIESKRRLEELQRADNSADAGEGKRPGDGTRQE